MLTWIAADKAAHLLQTTDQPPGDPRTQGPLRLPIIMMLSAKKAPISQEAFLQLGPPGPLQLVFIRRGQCLFRLDLIGVPSTLPIYVSTACRDNGLSQEQVHMHRCAISPAAPDLRASKAAAVYMKLRSFQGNDLIIDVLKGHHQHLTTLVVDSASFKSTCTILCPAPHVVAEPRAVLLWALVMQQAMRGVDYMTTGGNGDLGSLLRITIDPSKLSLGFMQARASPVEVPAQPRLLSDPSEVPAIKIADGEAQEPLEKQPEVSRIRLSPARSQTEDAQEQSSSSQQIRQEIEACIQPLLLQQESRLTAKIDALSNKLDAVLQLFSSSQVSTGTLSVATQTSEVDAISTGRGPSALVLLSVKRKLSARDAAAPAEACFIPAGYGMEAADPVAEEEAAPADHSRNAVIKSLPVQLKSSSSPPLPQLELSSPPPTKLALISSLPLPQPAVSSQQLGSPSAPDTEESDDDVQLGHDSSLVSTLHQAESQNRAEEDQGEGGAAEEEEDNAEEEALEEGEVREEEGGGLEGDANDRGGQMGTLDSEEQRDLLEVGGSDAQAMYNEAVMHALNDEVGATQHRPAPILQQPQPLRRPPTTPNEVTHSVHRKVVQMTHLAAAPIPDMHKIQGMLHHDATEASASIDRGAVSVEAQLKMQLADSIFDDLIGDTASMLLDLDLL
ncbi:hypothetical protein WJX82_004623 [Trebouxia sp. C0006]